ncbi:hypothetical protein NLJ89_g3346 [Agrocybe chaxingu]|uniref:SnoaL-like domain-containing protein n=1 Tax=Agrocybe chaxingu TaxID=84603 RepID=A0A9W8K4W5_9AGAR|nr:hypothetical protein NLJ89_g3346 [Agrocybe chaxingu]
MSTEETRSVIEQWVGAISVLDIAALQNIAAPGARYWTSGPKEKIPFAGDLSYADRIGGMPKGLGQVKSRKFTNRGIVVEGDTGVLELHLTGEGQGGYPIDNGVMIKFVVKDGKIQDVREYMDATSFFRS